MKLSNKGRIAGATAALALCACYSYVPAEFEAVPLGEEVRVYLSSRGMVRLAELTEGEVTLPGQPIVGGALAGRDESEFSLRIPVASRQVGFLQSQISQQVTLQRDDLVQVTVRQFDKTRTGLTVGASAAAIAGVIAFILGSSEGEDRPPTPDGPEDLRVPVFSFPIR